MLSKVIYFHSFADDSQICLHCPLSWVSSAVRKLEDYLWSRPLDVGQSPEAECRQDRASLVRSRHKLATFGGCAPSLQLGAEVIRASDHVRLLGVFLIAADLSLDRHVSNVCKTCFFWLRQLRRVRPSFVGHWVTEDTIVHVFVTSRVDYCNSVLASAPKTITDELQRVLNAAARLISISCTSKYDRGLSALLHDELHWLDIPQRI